MRIVFSLLLVCLLSACNNNKYVSPISPEGNVVVEMPSESATLIPYSDDNSLQFAKEVDQEGNPAGDGLTFNGKKEGAWIIYSNKYSRQNLEAVYNYKDGIKHGPYFIMDNGSSLKEVGSFFEGKLDGQRTVFSRNRRIEVSNFKNGMLDGLSTHYYDDGEVKKEEGNYVNGKRNGEHQWFDLEGNVKISYTYKNGEQVN